MTTKLIDSKFLMCRLGVCPVRKNCERHGDADVRQERAFGQATIRHHPEHGGSDDCLAYLPISATFKAKKRKKKKTGAA